MPRSKPDKLSAREWLSLANGCLRASREYPAFDCFRVGETVARVLSGVRTIKNQREPNLVFKKLGASLVVVLAMLISSTAFGAPATGSNCTALTKATTAATSAANLASTPTVGNKVWVGVSEYAIGSYIAATAADNQSNTYVSNAAKHAGVTLPEGLIVFSADVGTASGTFTVTITSHSTTSSFAWMACEMTGVLTSSAFDKAGTAEGANPSTSITVTASGANAQASEIVFACIYDGNGGNAASGYTVLYSDTTLIGSWCGYKVVSGIETSAASWTYSSFTDALAVLATYKAASAATASHASGMMGMLP